MRIRAKYFYSALIPLAIVVPALAQQPTASTTSLERLRQIVEYLASDALEGRRTGTPGANDAAHYIAGEFNRFGLRPGMQMARPARKRAENQARYLQPFPFVASVQLGKDNSLLVQSDPNSKATNFKVDETWLPLGFSANGRVDDAQVVYVGFGITAPELKYDDYANIDVKNKVALAGQGTPDGDNPHGQFARFEDIRFKAVAAREHGAKALLVISRESKLKDDRLSRLHYDNNGDAGIPVIVISQS